MSLAENQLGQRLLSFIKMSEEKAITEHLEGPITSSFAFIKVKDQFLVAYNKWRNQWEFPAGKIEKGESLRECAIRELYEETGQCVNDLVFKGLFKVFDERSRTTKYRAAFFAETDHLSEFIENDEMSEIMLWDLNRNIGYVDEVDLKMLLLCLE